MRREQLMKGWISTTEELVALVLNYFFFVVAFLLKSVSKRNDAWLYATSMPEDVAWASRRDLLLCADTEEM